MKSAYWHKEKGWIFPQVHYHLSKRITKKKLLEVIHQNPLIQEAVQIDPRVEALLKEASLRRCTYGYNWEQTFYRTYKPQVTVLVGWESPHKTLQSSQHYDALYNAVYELLPDDEVGLYPDGIMPNGAYSPSLQERYEREYP